MSSAANALAVERPLGRFEGTVDSLWTGLTPRGQSQGVRRILFTSARRGQGTTTLAACAAVGLARHLNARVALIEAGAPSTALAELMGIAPTPGLSELLCGVADAERVVRPAAVQGLSVVPSGTMSRRPAPFATASAREFLASVARAHDFVILDAPPVHALPEMRPLLGEVDQAVVVVAAGRTRKDELGALMRALDDARVEVLGCVLNRCRPDMPAWMANA